MAGSKQNCVATPAATVLLRDGVWRAHVLVERSARDGGASLLCEAAASALGWRAEHGELRRKLEAAYDRLSTLLEGHPSVQATVQALSRRSARSTFVIMNHHDAS